MADIPKPIWTSNGQTVLYRHGDVEQIVADNAALRTDIHMRLIELAALRERVKVLAELLWERMSATERIKARAALGDKP